MAIVICQVVRQKRCRVNITSRDDLIPTVLLAHELVKKGVPQQRIGIALIRVSTESEIQDANDYIAQSEHHCFKGYLPEKPAYRQAQNRRPEDDLPRLFVILWLYSSPLGCQRFSYAFPLGR